LVAFAIAALLCLASASGIDHLGSVSPDPPSWTVAVLLRLSSVTLAIVSIGTAAATEPRGRGTRPAFSALGLVFVFVLVVISQAGGLSFGD
jgi:hypothetical protein